ncbi:MAG: PD40 domain-containing protein [Saprospiraceae bacterium]|nr:PD40 domain-containing protein [Saprospiraceae bacterium]
MGPFRFVPLLTPEYNVAYPTLSIDGQKIIFSSDKPGGKGGYDLYMCIERRKMGYTNTS